MNVADALRDASSTLASTGLKEPQRDARLLLAFAADKPKEFLFAHPEYELDANETEAFCDAIRRRAAHEPVQYITGRTEFYGREFEVSPAVLIPRPETEILVEKAVDSLKNLRAAHFCEVGAGSGCISVSMLAELPNATAVAVDISSEALETARRNAVRRGVAERLELRESDVFDSVPEIGFDAVVSNPPYISLEEIADLDREVRDFEPETALTDRADGLAVIRKIVAGSYHKLAPGGVLFMEIGFGQAERIPPLLSPDRWQNVGLFDDLQAIPRLLRAFRR